MKHPIYELYKFAKRGFKEHGKSSLVLDILRWLLSIIDKGRNAK